MRIMSRRETPLSLSRFLVGGFLLGMLSGLSTMSARNTDSIRPWRFEAAGADKRAGGAGQGYRCRRRCSTPKRGVQPEMRIEA
jgi:hypothetical protein